MEKVEGWLNEMLSAHESSLDGLEAWSLETLSTSIVARFKLSAEELTLTFRPVDGEPSWFSSESVAVNVACQTQPSSEEVRRLLRQLRGLFVNLPGAFTGTKSSPSRGDTQALLTAPSPKLHRAAFHAWKLLHEDKRLMPVVERHDGMEETKWRTLVQQDFYPHPGVLGVEVGEEAILEGWKRVSQDIRDAKAPRKVGLYIHFPFCAERCRFCYCSMTTSIGGGRLTQYHQRLLSELERYGEAIRGLELSSVYIGGGTPSLMNVEMLKSFFRTLHQAFKIPPSTQFTFETNPDSLNPTKLEVMARVGRVNRITLGVQTLDPEAQRRANRFNNAGQVRELVAKAKSEGMLVHIDLMAGMDGQSFDSFKQDVHFILSLKPESLHLSGFRPVALDSPTHDVEQVENRREMLRWGNRQLSEHGLNSRLGLPPTSRRDAGNLQFVHGREESASLIGIGVAANAHAFGQYFYETSEGFDTMAGVDAALPILTEGSSRVMRAVPSGVEDEAHRYVIANLQEGFLLSRFRKLFAREPRELNPEAWDLLLDTGVLSIVGDEVKSHIRSHRERLIYGVLFYSPWVVQRMNDLWGDEYNPTEPYLEWLNAMTVGAS